MTGNLSGTMQRALDAIRAHGGIAEAEDRGCWKGADGVRLEATSTQTIYALYRRGLLKRTRKDWRAHRDTYLVV